VRKERKESPQQPERREMSSPEIGLQKSKHKTGQ